MPPTLLPVLLPLAFLPLALLLSRRCFLVVWWLVLWLATARAWPLLVYLFNSNSSNSSSTNSSNSNINCNSFNLSSCSRSSSNLNINISSSSSSSTSSSNSYNNIRLSFSRSSRHSSRPRCPMPTAYPSRLRRQLISPQITSSGRNLDRQRLKISSSSMLCRAVTKMLKQTTTPPNANDSILTILVKTRHSMMKLCWRWLRTTARMAQIHIPQSKHHPCCMLVQC